MSFCTRSWWAIRTTLNSSVLSRSSTNFRERAATTPADTWVAGMIFLHDDTKSKDKRAPNGTPDLDLVSKDLPVVVIHRGGHTAFSQQQSIQNGRHQQIDAKSSRWYSTIMIPMGN